MSRVINTKSNDRGYPEDAVPNVMMAMVGVDEGPKFYSLDEALEKHNFTERMKDCVDITNNPAYMIVHLKYKAIYEFMLERSAVHYLHIQLVFVL